MSKVKILAVIGLLLFTFEIQAQPLPKPTNLSANSFQILNIMDDFWKYWEKGEKADIPTRTKLFREMVINPHKEIFENFL